MKRRVAYLLPITLVAALCAASLVLLWRAGDAVVAREQNRQRLLQSLAKAEAQLAKTGAAGLLLLPEWPDSLGREEWIALDAWLSDGARRSLGDPNSGLTGGYYLAGFNRFLGDNSVRSDQPPSPPATIRAIVESQIIKALDEDQAQTLIIDATPRPLAIRTAPVWVNGRQVAATWTFAALDGATALASAVANYRLSAALALAGIALALGLAIAVGIIALRNGRERARLQAELQRSERLAALGKLVAGVAHEVRNPLAGIRSTAQLAERGIALDQDATADLISEVDRLETIVSRLLQFTRVGREAPKPARLNDVVTQAIRTLRPRAEKIGVLIELDLAQNLPTMPLANSSLIQVLRNLVANALDAMSNGGILRVTTSPSTRDRSRGAAVVVTDTGPGFDAATSEHLFEPFYTTKPEGTGLGLAIAREIALAHGGQLSAANRADGPGARFELWLPLDPPAAVGQFQQPDTNGQIELETPAESSDHETTSNPTTPFQHLPA